MAVTFGGGHIGGSEDYKHRRHQQRHHIQPVHQCHVSYTGCKEVYKWNTVFPQATQTYMDAYLCQDDQIADYTLSW